jgi:short-subunit dehydrogenase
VSFVLIIGSKSDIGKAIARAYASEGYDLYLASRQSGENREFSNDIRIRFNRQAECIELDILDFETHCACYESLAVKPAGVIATVGYLGSQDLAQSDLAEAKKIIDSNYTGIVSFLNVVANDFESRGSGFIVGITSVAGDRGRKGNYLYGSSKAALSAYLSGLRNRLSSANVQVLTVKPGFVNTKMTAGLDLPAALTVEPDTVSKAVIKAQKRKRNVIYVPWIWRWIMLVTKAIPEFIFKRTSI